MTRSQEIFEQILALKRSNTSFAIATVIDTRGSSSGRLGDKALFSLEGRRLAGWVGGGCIERMVGECAVQAFAEGRPRQIHINLDGDDLFLSIPCGGEMTVMVEPQQSEIELFIKGVGQITESLAAMAVNLGYRVTVQTQGDESIRYPGVHRVITENKSLSELDVHPRYLVLATHHPDDNLLATEALERGVPYVAVIASSKRAGLLREFITGQGISPDHLENLHSPAGIDLGATSPEEIALSIMSQIVIHRNQASGDSRLELEETVTGAFAEVAR